jgi:small-conductance mechanosensitive channel/CRP-like cAMP-binding protein
VHPSLAWFALALLVCTVAVWRPAHEKSRLRNVAGLLLLWLLAWTLSFFPPQFRPSDRICEETAIALLTLAAIQLAVVMVFDLALRRVRHPRFLTEMVVVAGYIGTLLHLLIRVGLDVTGVFTTSAVATAVLGLALQDMLSNIAGGVALELEDGIRVGDFITVADRSGWVQHIRLRHTAITTRDGDTVILPNSVLMRSAVNIMSRRHRHFLPFSMPYSTNPQEVIEAVEFALRTSPIPGVATDPEPRCVVQQMSPGAIQYAAVIWLTEPGVDLGPTSAALVRLSFALHRAGVPVREITTVLEMQKGKADHKKPDALDILRRTPILRLLEDADLHELAASLQPVSFAPGEAIIRQGDSADSMYFIVSGDVTITFRASDGTDRQVSVMESGDFFGEASLLTGEMRTASALARTKVDCYRLDKKGLQNIVQRRSDLAEDMSVVMAHRQMELAIVREKLDQETARKREAESQAQLLTKIRRFFEVS